MPKMVSSATDTFESYFDSDDDYAPLRCWDCNVNFTEKHFLYKHLFHHIRQPYVVLERCQLPPLKITLKNTDGAGKKFEIVPEKVATTGKEGDSNSPATTNFTKPGSPATLNKLAAEDSGANEVPLTASEEEGEDHQSFLGEEDPLATFPDEGNGGEEDYCPTLSPSFANVDDFNECSNQGRKTNKRRWSPSRMANAINAIRNKKMGWRKASKMFNVPKTTLMRLSNTKYGTPEEAAKTKRGRPTVLGKDLEEELVRYCLAMEASFFGLTHGDLRRMAVQLAERNKIEHPFKDDIAGKKWVTIFLQRHKRTLSAKRPTGTSYRRSLGFSKENTEVFYNLLEDVYEKFSFSPERIYNVDISGITMVKSKVAKVIALKSKKQIAALTSKERDALITIVACMNASGSFVPPLVIFPRKNMSDQLKKGAPTGTIFAAHPSGWIEISSFTQWFRHFIESVHPTNEKPVLLLLDGHYSHTRNIDFIDLAKSNHVTIVSLPPHSSHRLEPLDKTFMASLKTYYSDEIRQWLRHNERAISDFDVMELFGKAYVKCQTTEIAINGFRVTGIYPLNKRLFSDADFIEEANKQRGCSIYESKSKSILDDPNRPSTSSASHDVPLSSTTLDHPLGSHFLA